MNAAIGRNERQRIYWHRDLPPLEAEFIAEHTVEAHVANGMRRCAEFLHRLGVV